MGKKIPTGKPLVQLSGEVIPISQTDPRPFTVGKALANILASHAGRKLDHFKLWTLAQKFYSANGSVEVDNPDFEVIKQIVAEDQSYPGSMVTGQVEAILFEVKETKEKESAAGKDGG